MTWGHGLGTLFGGDPIEPVSQPLSEVGGPPTSWDFTDEPNGPLPGLWETYSLEHDGLGGMTWAPEPAPGTYFRVLDGKALWQYERTPALPGVGVPYSERGYVAGPSGVLEGRNARVSLIARQPIALLDGTADEFEWIVGIALRLDPSRGRFVGARMRAHWQAGSWVTPLILESIYADGGEVMVGSSVTPTAEPDLLDVWRTQPTTELVVELRGADMVATLGGIIALVAQVPADNFDPQAAIFSSVYNRAGTTIAPLPSIVGVSFQSLRDLERLGPPPQIPGALHLEAPDFPMMKLPIRALLDAGIVQQLRGRQFKFLTATTVEVQHQTFFFEAGEVVRIHEKLASQDFIPSTRDLNFERTRTR